MRAFFLAGCFAFALLVYFAATSGFSTNRYVDTTNGLDANSGADWQNAKKTIQAAVNLSSAGDYIWVTNGLYNERVSITINGTLASPIYLIAIGHTNVIVRGFDNTGDNIKHVGFEITHATEVGYAAVDLITATNNLFDCMYIHSVDTGGNGSFQADRSDGMILRNSIMAYSESAGTTNATSPLTANARSICLDRGPNKKMLVEFCHIYQVGDYINPFGTNIIIQGITMGPTTPDYAAGTPHDDGLQCDGATHYIHLRNIFGATNATHDAHFILLQPPATGPNNGNIVAHHIVWISNGDQLHFEMTDTTNILYSHSSVYKAGTGPGHGGPATSGFIRETGTGNGKVINGIFTNGTAGTVFTVDGTGFITRSNNCAWSVASDFTDGVNGNKKQDPKFVDVATGNFMLRSDSPCIDTGIHETWVTSSSGSGTNFVVDNSVWFTDGMGITFADKIDVGDDKGLTITAINYTTHTITVSQSITWAQNDPVSYAARGSGPDMGGYEFGDTLLSAATYATSGSDIIVTPTGDAAQCTAYTNWVPMQTIYGAGPYTFSGISGISLVKFIVNPAHPQFQEVFVATQGAAGGGGAQQKNKGRSTVRGFSPIF